MALTAFWNRGPSGRSAHYNILNMIKHVPGIAGVQASELSGLLRDNIKGTDPCRKCR